MDCLLHTMINDYYMMRISYVGSVAKDLEFQAETKSLSSPEEEARKGWKNRIKEIDHV